MWEGYYNMLVTCHAVCVSRAYGESCFLCRYYNATIDVISADNESCTLTFEGYNSTEIVRLCDLRPFGWEEEEEGRGGVKRKKVDARANAK